MNVNLVKRNNLSVDLERVCAVSESMGLNPKFVELLFSRGINDEKDIHSFIYPDEKNFYDPFLMKGMRDAVERINKAVKNKEKIVIYGDYDADGICANSILSLYFSNLNIDIYSHTPNRLGEDYGLNADVLEKIIEEVMPDLIITCDCGISCVDEVELVKDLGVDIIVTDHHEVGAVIPDCIVINPKQVDCEYPFKMLCGAGVALKLVQALSGNDVMYKYLDLCAIATIADLVPLLDENRLIVQLGLKKICLSENVGILLLLEDQKIKNPLASDIAFKIAPRINAAGRMGDAYRAFDLLTTKDREKAKRIIEEINIDNNHRKLLCEQMFNEAIEDLQYENIVDNRAIMLSHPTWEKGITGIVAAKLCNQFNRPAFIMVKSGDSYKGTCRSIEGINIYNLLTACSDLLLEFGGHSQAAGFSIDVKNIPEFKERICSLLNDFDEQLFYPKAEFDMELDAENIDFNLVEALELMEPIGNSNSKPLFKIRENSLLVYPCKNNSNHVSIVLENKLQIFAFNYSTLAYQLLTDKPKDLVVELQRNVYGGREVKGVLRACVPHELYVNSSVASSYNLGLMRYNRENLPEFSEYKKIEDVYSQSLYGTLVIADSFDRYKNFIAEHKILLNEYMYVVSQNNYSRIIVAPDLDQKNIYLKNYHKIIFLFRPYDLGVISYLNFMTSAKIFIPEKKDEFPIVSSERNVFMKYYDMLKTVNGLSFPNIQRLFGGLKNNFSEIDLNQLYLCINVFSELDLIKIERNPYIIHIQKNKADLNDSRIYRYIKQREV